MEIEIIMPKLGLTMSKGTILEWKKKEGDEVRKDEVVGVVESEKVTNDLHAPQDGIVKKILYQEGDEVSVGEPIAIIETVEKR
jgi:pyruvate/2-oxoglutarate dehydrogenase complex dihydrolipoamide acyltransferase (E2) component|uniref:Biotin/lipoyl-binding protein n=1 Tax=Fervidicoccus fontis TaxID=683846 RepID=A0A7J3SL82_9CREN